MTQAGDAIFTEWVGLEPEQIERDLGFLRAFKALDPDDLDQLLTFGELLAVGKRKVCREAGTGVWDITVGEEED